MTIHELDRLTNIIIKDFIKELFGLDYNDIILPKNIPIILSSKNMYGSGAFLLPQNNELLQNSFEEGIIVLNGKFYNTLLSNVTDSDYDINNLIVTLIHEKIHANKVVMTNYSAFGCQDNHNLNDTSLLEEYNHLLQKQDVYIDPIQDKKSFDQFFEVLDEALVELISILAFRMFKNKKAKRNETIMDMIKIINQRCEKDDDIKIITNIMIRHNDLDLLKWAIYPLEFQEYDMMYDYFNQYVTTNDMMYVKKMYKKR